MLVPVTPVDCPKCRCVDVVVAFKHHSGNDRCLCWRCGEVWDIAPTPVNTAKPYAAVPFPASQRDG